jgi:hypothetical protein
MPTGDATGRLAIGSCSSAFSWCAFAGQIDELAIYDRA